MTTIIVVISLHSNFDKVDSQVPIYDDFFLHHLIAYDHAFLNPELYFKNI